MILRKVLFKIGKKGGVSEMLQARGGVGHGVGESWDESDQVAVAVDALVLAGKPAEVGGSRVARHRPLPEARDSGSVVAGIREGRVADVMGMGHDVGLAQDASLLEVTVGDLPRGVVEGDQVALDVRRKGGTPDVGFSLGVEEHPTHSRFGCVGGS